jgi:hypothetical protein
LLELPGGRSVNCIFWNHLFKEFPEVQQFQVVLCKDGSLQFLLVGKGFSPPREAELTGILRGFLKTIPYRLSWVETIPRTARGKLIQVVMEGPQREHASAESQPVQPD